MGIALELGRSGSRWVSYATIAGIGRRTGGDTVARRAAYRICTQHPRDLGWTDAASGQFQELLDSIDGMIGESVDLRSGDVTLGAVTLLLADYDLRTLTGEPAHGWDPTDPVTDWLMVHAPATRWKLAADVLSSTPETVETWHFADTTGMVVDGIYHIGAEAVCVQSINVDTIHAAVIRGALGTTCQVHRVAGESVAHPPGEGWVYDRPQHLLGRPVELWVALVDAATGELQPATDHLRIWRGQLSEYAQADAGRWALTCAPLMGRLDGPIGRCAMRASVTCSSQTGTAHGGGDTQVQRDFPEGMPLPVVGLVASGAGWPVYYPLGADTPEAVQVHRFHARIGDQIVECGWPDATGAGSINAYYFGLLGTDPTWTEEQLQAGAQIHDVLLCSPRPGGSDLCFFKTAAGTVYDDPVDVALALITSRLGDYANGQWDCLPFGWGRGVPVAEIDASGFARFRGQAHCAGLVLGWDGRPFNLRRWLQQYLLGPLGWYLSSTEAGLVALRSARDYYPLESWPALTERDLMPGALLVGQLGQTLGSSTLLTDWDLKTGQHIQSYTYRTAEQLERYEDSGGDVTLDAHAYAAEDAGALLYSRCPDFARWWTVPRPLLRCSIGLDRLADTLLDGVLVTETSTPNPDTGARGLVSVPALVTSRRINLQSGTIDLELMLLGSPAVGLWTPSARVTASARAGAGAPYVWTLTCAANDFSDAADGPPGAPTTDVDAFRATDVLHRHTADGTIGNANAYTVTAIGANSLTCSSSDASAAGWTGYVSFARWLGGTAPAVAWTAGMVDRGMTQASGDPPVLPGAPTAPRVYGS